MLPDGCRVPKVLFFLELGTVKCQFVCRVTDYLQHYPPGTPFMSFNKSLTYRLIPAHLGMIF
jgi:hypothetical protein